MASSMPLIIAIALALNTYTTTFATSLASNNIGGVQGVELVISTISAAPTTLPNSPEPAPDNDGLLFPSPVSDTGIPPVESAPIIPSNPSPPNPDAEVVPGSTGPFNAMAASKSAMAAALSPLTHTSVYIGCIMILICFHI